MADAAHPPQTQHSRLGIYPGPRHMVGGLWPLHHSCLGCLLRTFPAMGFQAEPSAPHLHILALSFPWSCLSEVRLETGSGPPSLATGHTHPLILEQELLLLFKALNIHTGWRGGGLLPSPPPRNRELGAQALPGIGHGPPWQSWVTGKCPSSAGLQAAQTMLGCPGLWPPKTKRGWEIAPRDPFIPRAGRACTALALCRLQGLRPPQAPRLLVRTLVQDKLQGLRGKGEGDPPDTPEDSPGPSGPSGHQSPAPPCVPQPRTHVDPTAY